MRRIVAVGLAVAALLGAVLGTTADNSYEACFRSKINVERTARNIPALTDSEAMNMIARRHSDEMAEQATIYHNDNLPNEPGVKPFAAVGENVGMGSNCEIIHKAFMDSPSHRTNILDPDYRQLGVGVTEKDDTLYVTTIFYAPAKTPAKPPGKPKPEPACTCPG